MAAENIFSSELNNANITSRVLFNNVFVSGLALVGSSVRSVLLNADLSRGSVTTFVKNGGIFNDGLLQIYLLVCK